MKMKWMAVAASTWMAASAVQAQSSDGFADRKYRASNCHLVTQPASLPPAGSADAPSVTQLVLCVKAGIEMDLNTVFPVVERDHEKLEKVKKKADDTEKKLSEEIEDRQQLDERVAALEGKSGGDRPNGNGGKPSADSALAGRVAALEAQVNALQAAVAALKGQNPAGKTAQTVRAPFQVVDATNKPLLTVAEFGSGARVTVASTSGQSAVEISTDKGGAITVRDVSGAARAQLGLEADGRYSLTLLTAQKQPVAKLSSAKDGAGGVIGVFDRAGAPRIFMEGGTPRLLVQDGSAQPKAVIGMDEGHGIVGILSNGNTLAGLGAYPGGAGGRLWLNDAGGNWLFKAGKNDSGGDACASSGKGVKCLAAGRF